MIRLLISLVLMISCASSMAQTNGANQNNEPSAIEKYGPRRQISTIVYMGLAGAVLGLSTLSFYGRPQDKLTNIPIGFGVGVVIGTIYMTYQAAANPNDFYNQGALDYVPEYDKPSLQKDLLASDLLVKKDQPHFSYSWSF